MLFNQLNLFSLLDAMDVEVSRGDREALNSLWQPQQRKTVQTFKFWTKIKLSVT